MRDTKKINMRFRCPSLRSYLYAIVITCWYWFGNLFFWHTLLHFHQGLKSLTFFIVIGCCYLETFCLENPFDPCNGSDQHIYIWTIGYCFWKYMKVFSHVLVSFNSQAWCFRCQWLTCEFCCYLRRWWISIWWMMWFGEWVNERREWCWWS